jgi:YD repeat-containing protein
MIRFVLKPLVLTAGLMITPTSHAIDYIYDDLNRLIQVNYPTGQTISYSYDSVGNLLSVTLIDSNTDTANQLAADTSNTTE